MAKLREHERRTLSTVVRLGGEANASKLVKESELSDAAVMRAAIMLQGKRTCENS